jgi:hypothetical protein
MGYFLIPQIQIITKIPEHGSTGLDTGPAHADSKKKTSGKGPWIYVARCGVWFGFFGSGSGTVLNFRC